MNLPGKITAAASALVVGGLIALAAPAVASIGQAAHDAAEGVGRLTATAEPTTGPTAEPVADAEEPPPGIAPDGPLAADGRVHISLGGGVTVAVLPGECIQALIQDNRLLGTLVDHGESTYAHGTVVFNDAGKIKGYEVADGDTLFAIGERFCMSSAHIFYANRPADLPPDTGYMIQPGQVLILDPGA